MFLFLTLLFSILEDGVPSPGGAEKKKALRGKTFLMPSVLRCAFPPNQPLLPSAGGCRFDGPFDRRSNFMMGCVARGGRSVRFLQISTPKNRKTTVFLRGWFVLKISIRHTYVLFLYNFTGTKIHIFSHVQEKNDFFFVFAASLPLV